MTTYDKVKTEALALPAAQQDGLLKELALAHALRKTNELAERSGGWVQWAWRAVALAIGAAGAFLATGCSSSVTQTRTGEDGTVTVTEHVFSLSAAEARDLIKLYGAPQVPVVNAVK